MSDEDFTFIGGADDAWQRFAISPSGAIFIDALLLVEECMYCGEPIVETEPNIWVDDTDGDCCSGDDNNVNENMAHMPRRLLS